MMKESDENASNAFCSIYYASSCYSQKNRRQNQRMRMTRTKMNRLMRIDFVSFSFLSLISIDVDLFYVSGLACDFDSDFVILTVSAIVIVIAVAEFARGDDVMVDQHENDADQSTDHDRERRIGYESDGKRVAHRSSRRWKKMMRGRMPMVHSPLSA